MNELAAEHPRWGYRMVWTLLRGEGWSINRKRVERLWRLEGHRVPPRRVMASGKKAQGVSANSIWSLAATAPNEVWSYDFMGRRLRTGASLHILNIVDEFTREAIACRVDRSIGTKTSARTRGSLRAPWQARGAALGQWPRVYFGTPGQLVG